MDFLIISTAFDTIAMISSSQTFLSDPSLKQRNVRKNNCCVDDA